MPVTSALRSSRAPWIVAAGAGAVAVALFAILFAMVLPDRHDAQGKGIKVFTADEQAALNAARVQAVNISSFRRTDFDADFQRALAGTTGDLKTDLQGQGDDMKKQLTTEKIDVAGQIVASAVQETADGKVSVMVVLNGTANNDAGQTADTGPQRITLVMVKQGGKWLASSLTGASLAQVGQPGTASPTGTPTTSGTSGTSGTPKSTPASAPAGTPTGTGAAK